MISALIPARKGSKRVKDKNIRFLGGMALLNHSVLAAKQCNLIDRVIVSTDSGIYAEIARMAGAEVIFRPPEAASDTADDYDVVKHYLGQRITRPELIVYLRPTTPLRKSSLVDIAINEFKGLLATVDPPTSLRSVHEMAESAFKCFTMIGPCLVPIGVGSVEEAGRPNAMFEKTYKPNGYVDIIRTDFVLKNCKVWGDNAYGFITPPVTEVDTEHELQLLEFEIAMREGGKFVFA